MSRCALTHLAALKSPPKMLNIMLKTSAAFMISFIPIASQPEARHKTNLLSKKTRRRNVMFCLSSAFAKAHKQRLCPGRVRPHPVATVPKPASIDDAHKALEEGCLDYAVCRVACVGEGIEVVAAVVAADGCGI